MQQDLIFAFRQFARRPGPFAIAVLGLALAIGLSTATFSLVNAVAFRGYGIVADESVVRVVLSNSNSTAKTGGSFAQGNWAYSDFVRLQREVTSLDSVASFLMYSSVEEQSGGASEPSSRIGGLAVSGNYFRVLGGQALLGRSLNEADDSPGSPPVIQLSYAFWRVRLAGDPSAIGRTLWLESKPFTIVGVAARGFIGPPVSGSPPAYWIPLNISAQLLREKSSATAARAQEKIASLKTQAQLSEADREGLMTLEANAIANTRFSWDPPVYVFGRLKGKNRAQTEAELAAMAPSLTPSQPSSRPPLLELRKVGQTGRDSSLFTTVSVVFLTVSLVVVLACVNVANILLASATTRGREIGTRLALGASRLRIVRQMLTESLLLSIVAGVIGLAIAIGLVPVVASRIQLPPFLDIWPDPLVFLFVSVLTALVGIGAGLAPARHGSRGDLISALKGLQAGRTPTPISRRLTQYGLVGSQAAAAVVLLVVAALFARSLINAKTLQLGFDPSRLIAVTVDFGRAYDSVRAQSFWDTALARLQLIGGAGPAALTITPPFGTSTSVQRLQNGKLAFRHETSASYFDVIGVKVIRGRTYTAAEVRQGAPVAVISASLAGEFWPNENPVGSGLERVWGSPTKSDFRAANRKPAGTQVIGVVADTITTLQLDNSLAIYIPLGGWFAPNAHLMLISRTEPTSLVATVRETVRSIDPELQVAGVLVREGLKRELQIPETLAILASGAGAAGLALALIGFAGVASFAVSLRHHEIGVRLALGATRADIMRMLLWATLMPASVGLVLGVLVSFLIGRAIQGALFGIGSQDPLAILMVCATFLGAASLAAYFPARRGSRIDPCSPLKQQ